MKNIIVSVEQSPNNYSAWIELLPGCVTVGKTIEELIYNMHEAVYGHIDISREYGDYIHPDFDGEYELIFKFDTSKIKEKARNVPMIEVYNSQPKVQKRKLELA
jgi:predicted RNase H-like HicB family nuclease